MEFRLSWLGFPCRAACPRRCVVLLAAEQVTRVRHLVALTIVGADRAQERGYLRAKRAQEKLVGESGSPYSIVRATHFPEFVNLVADSATDDDKVRLPHAAFRPVVDQDVATAVTRATIGQLLNGAIDVAGPEKLGREDFIRSRFAASGDPPQVVADPSAPLSVR